MELKSSQGIPVGDQNNNSFVWNNNTRNLTFFQGTGSWGMGG